MTATRTKPAASSSEPRESAEARRSLAPRLLPPPLAEPMEPSPGREGEGSLPGSEPPATPTSRAAAAAAAAEAAAAEAAAAAACGPGRYSQIETRAKEPAPADLTNRSSEASIVERTPPAEERNNVVTGEGADAGAGAVAAESADEEEEPPAAAMTAASAPSAAGGGVGGGGARSRSPLPLIEPPLAAAAVCSCWLNEAVMAAVPSIVFDFGVGARGGRRPERKVFLFFF